jgi:hypothetical protein
MREPGPPLPPGRDIAWPQHVAMNIADRASLYVESFCVLRCGGRFAIFDVVVSTRSRVPSFLLPALTSAVPVVFVFGIAFGVVLLSAVASTTVHNLPQEAWSSAISVFTVVFALGQILGPILVGWIADGPGGSGIDRISGCAVHRRSAGATAKGTRLDELMPAAIVTNTDFVSGERLTSPAEFARASLFGRFGGSPVAGPIAIAQYLVGGVNGKLHEHHSLGNIQYFAADLDDAPPQFETLIERSTAPDFDEHHRDRFKSVRTKVEEIVLAKFGDPHVGTPGLCLHHVRVESAQARRKVSLGLRWILLGQVQMQVRHMLISLFEKGRKARISISSRPRIQQGELVGQSLVGMARTLQREALISHSGFDMTIIITTRS